MTACSGNYYKYMLFAALVFQHMCLYRAYQSVCWRPELLRSNISGLRLC
jgi:hypothetical protein